MITVVPAYGREYKSKAEILKDWNAGKDFLIQPDDNYTNREDCERLKITGVQVRYKQKRQVAVLYPGESEWKAR